MMPTDHCRSRMMAMYFIHSTSLVGAAKNAYNQLLTGFISVSETFVDNTEYLRRSVVAPSLIVLVIAVRVVGYWLNSSVGCIHVNVLLCFCVASVGGGGLDGGNFHHQSGDWHD